MGPAALALVVYSCQILLIVAAAAVAEALLRRSEATARLTYWRAIGVLCLALPLIASTAQEHPAVSVAFDVRPVERVANTTASQVLPQVSAAIPWVWAAGAGIGLVWLLAGAWRIRQLRLRSVPASLGLDIDA